MKESQTISTDNWTFAAYKASDLLVFIHLGAEPSSSKDDSKIEILYLVTVLQNMEMEVFQKEYKSLEQAINFINLSYSHWDFIDRAEISNGSGCGTCEAH